MGKTGASVTEWSKVLRSGRSVFARVGSSPTACIFALLFQIVSLLIYIMYVTKCVVALQLYFRIAIISYEMCNW